MTTLSDMRVLERKAKKNMRFALAKTLTKLAQKSQAAIQDSIVSEFNTTKKWYLKSRPTGIKIKMAKKTSLVSEVFSGEKNTWLERHVAGNRRSAKKKNLIIPVYKGGKSPDKNDPKFRGIKSQTWRKAKGLSTAYSKFSSHRMSALTKGLNQRRYPFLIKSKKKDIVLIKRNKSSNFVPLFVKKTVTKRMNKRIPFKRTVKKMVKKQASYIFNRELRAALRS